METNEPRTKHCKRYNLPGHAHALTFSCYQRQPFLLDQAICKLLSDSINGAAQKHRFSVWGYVLMPEHVHLLVFSAARPYSISAFLQSVKQPVARTVIHRWKQISDSRLSKIQTGQKHQPYRLWLPGGGFDQNLCDRNACVDVIRYMHFNPVKRKLVVCPSEWFYSSFNDWENQRQGPVLIDKKSFPAG
jgi:putative transposase